MPDSNIHANFFPYSIPAKFVDSDEYGYIKWGELTIFGDRTHGPTKDQLQRIVEIINEGVPKAAEPAMEQEDA